MRAKPDESPRRRTTLHAAVACALLAGMLAPAAPAQAQDSESQAALDEVVVTAKRHFRPESSNAASKLDLPVTETPQALTVLGSEFLEIADLNSTASVVAYTAGIENAGIGDGTEASLVARGFTIDRERSYRINGLSVYSEIDVDYFAMERVEFVRGPASSLYGEADYGATVNRVLKAPNRQFAGQVGMQLGNYSYRRFEGDVTGPLREDGNLTGRAVAVYEDSDTFIDGTETNHWLVAPSLRYSTDSTDYLLQAYYSDFGGVSSDGFALVREGGEWALPDVPRSRNYGATTNGIDSSNAFYFGRVTHSFSDTLKGIVAAGFSDVDMFNRSAYLCDCDGAEGDGTADLYFFLEDKKQENTSVDVSLEKAFTAFGREQRVLVSADYRKNKLHQPYGPGDLLASLDFVHDAGPVEATLPDLDTGNFIDEFQEFSGVSLLGYFKPADRLSMLLGMRYSKIKSGIYEFYDEEFIDGGKDNAWVPRVGLVYNLAGPHFVFASYSEGVIFNETALNAARNPIMPEEGVQYEMGVKGELFGKRLFYSVSAFTIDRKNLATAIRGQLPGAPAIYRNVGNQTHKGVDVELQGEPVPGFNLYMSYAFLDVAVKDSIIRAEEGQTPNAAPRQSLSLFATYEILRGPLRSLTLGGGLVARSERQIDSIGSFSLPAYERVDLRASYDVSDRLTLELNAKNIFDDKVYTSVYEAPIFGIAYSDVRSVSFGASYRF